MKVVEVFSHRNGGDILASPKFVEAYEEFLSVLATLPPYLSAKPKTTSAKHVVSPKAMNSYLDQQLAVDRDWDWHPLIISPDDLTDDDESSQLRSDFRKSRIEVEVQFGNVARYAYDVYKMAISMALGHSDVGVMVVATKKFAEITGGNIAYYERAVRELERSRLTLIVPLVVVGIEPDNWLQNMYPPESEAPKVTRETINAARERRGVPPVGPGSEDLMSLVQVEKLAARMAG